MSRKVKYGTYSARSCGAASLCAPVRWYRLSTPSPAACTRTDWTCRSPTSARDSRPARPCSRTWREPNSIDNSSSEGDALWITIRSEQLHQTPAPSSSSPPPLPPLAHSRLGKVDSVPYSPKRGIVSVHDALRLGTAPYNKPRMCWLCPGCARGNSLCLSWRFPVRNISKTTPGESQNTRFLQRWRMAAPSRRAAHFQLVLRRRMKDWIA